MIARASFFFKIIGQTFAMKIDRSDQAYKVWNVELGRLGGSQRRNLQTFGKLSGLCEGADFLRKYRADDNICRLNFSTTSDSASVSHVVSGIKHCESKLMSFLG